jgi:tetratricopeptide (TPR) repeat protein
LDVDRLTDYFGIGADLWLIILTAIIVILTLALVLKREKGIDPATAKLIEKILEKVPTPLDPKQLPSITKEDVKKLEEHAPSLIREMNGLVNLDFLIKLGNVEYTQGNLLKSLAYFNEALERAKLTKNSITIGVCLGNIGLIYSDKGDLDSALKYLEDALKIDREIGYKQGEAAALGNIGLIYKAKGDLDSALKYHEDALKIHREIGYKQGEANQLGNIGLIYSDKGDLDSALKYLEDALKILVEFKLVYGKDIITKAIKELSDKEKK